MLQFLQQVYNGISISRTRDFPNLEPKVVFPCIFFILILPPIWVPHSRLFKPTFVLGGSRNRDSIELYFHEIGMLSFHKTTFNIIYSKRLLILIQKTIEYWDPQTRIMNWCSVTNKGGWSRLQSIDFSLSTDSRYIIDYNSRTLNTCKS